MAGAVPCVEALLLMLFRQVAQRLASVHILTICMCTRRCACVRPGQHSRQATRAPRVSTPLHLCRRDTSLLGNWRRK